MDFNVIDLTGDEPRPPGWMVAVGGDSDDDGDGIKIDIAATEVIDLTAEDSGCDDAAQLDRVVTTNDNVVKIEAVDEEAVDDGGDDDDDGLAAEEPKPLHFEDISDVILTTPLAEFEHLYDRAWPTFTALFRDIQGAAARIGFCIYIRRPSNKDSEGLYRRYDLSCVENDKVESKGTGKKPNTKTISA
ncbi:hypothetical protein OQA88_13285 [Cercophora sp. LCS_1]